MRNIIFIILRYSGVPYLFRKILQKKKVTILMFHDINEITANKCFKYLQKNYNIIDLNQFIQAKIEQKVNILPKNSLVITFDDGHILNYKLLDVIKSIQISVTIFLCSEIINTNRRYWFKSKSKGITIENLKGLPNKKRLDILEENGFDQEKEYGEAQALNSEQINEMASFVNFQSHTRFHPCLPKCDEEEIFNELFFSKEKLENEYGFSINSIAYPNGDYSEKVIDLAKKAGYSCGLTIDHGFNSIKTDFFRLKRLSVNDTSNMNEFIVKSSGLWSFLRTINGLIKKGYHLE